MQEFMRMLSQYEVTVICGLIDDKIVEYEMQGNDAKIKELEDLFLKVKGDVEI